MENCLNKVMAGGSQQIPDVEMFKTRSSNTLSFDGYADYNSIQQTTKPKEVGVGSSSFVSKTKRDRSISEVPGPGHYKNTDFKYEFIKNIKK